MAKYFAKPAEGTQAATCDRRFMRSVQCYYVSMKDMDEEDRKHVPTGAEADRPGRRAFSYFVPIAHITFEDGSELNLCPGESVFTTDGPTETKK